MGEEVVGGKIVPVASNVSPQGAPDSRLVNFQTYLEPPIPNIYPPLSSNHAQYNYMQVDHT